MVTVKRVGNNLVDYDCKELFGLSTDEKPLNDLSNSSTFYEMDTKKMFIFDEENRIWLEM